MWRGNTEAVAYYQECGCRGSPEDLVRCGGNSLGEFGSALLGIHFLRFLHVGLLDNLIVCRHPFLINTTWRRRAGDSIG